MRCERKNCRFLPALCLCLLGLLPLYGQGVLEARHSAVLSPKADYILIIDNSNSIKSGEEKKLMRDACRLFINVLEEGDKLAMIAFSDRAEWLFGEELKSIPERSALAEKAIAFLRFETGQSNINAAFQLAAQRAPSFWRERDNFGQKVAKIVILISDGRLYLKPEGAVPQAYNRLKTAVRNHFREASLHCLEIKTAESAAKIPGLDITGSELLKDLTRARPEGYRPLDQLIDMVENYVEIVKENKATTTFTSLHTPLEINKAVDEVRLFILRHNRQFREVRSEDIRILVADSIELRYNTAFEAGRFVRDDFFVQWNAKEGFDIVTISRAHLKQPGAPAPELENRKTLSVRLPHITERELPDRNVFAVESRINGNLSPSVRPEFLANHPIPVATKLWEKDPHTFPPGGNNRLLTDREVTANITPAGQTSEKMHRLQLDPSDSIYLLDLHRAIPGIDTGMYYITFYANVRNSDIPPSTSKKISFRVQEDYIRSNLAGPLEASDLRPREVPVGVTINRKSEAFRRQFHSEHPLLEAIAIITRDGEDYAADTLQLTEDQGGRITYSGSVTLGAPGVYEVRYHLSGLRPSEEVVRDGDDTRSFPLARICHSWVWAALHWGKLLAIPLACLALLAYLIRLRRPPVNVALDLIEGNGQVQASNWKNRVHRYSIQMGGQGHHFEIYPAYRRDADGQLVVCLKNIDANLRLKNGREEPVEPGDPKRIFCNDELIISEGKERVVFSILF